jgi:hypothetical protein
LKNFATPGFWACYATLPAAVRKQADRAFGIFKTNPNHPSLHFKKVGAYWSARISDGYRALANRDGDTLVWVWIGQHDGYMRLIRGR